MTLATLLLLGSTLSSCHGSVLRARDSVPAGYVAAPYYPAPYGGWVPSWADSYAKAKALVDKMTLAEKTNITSGTGLSMGKTRHH